MRLLICTQAVDTGDPVLGFFHRWVEEFSKHCESVIVVCLREGDHQLPANVKVLSLGKEQGKGRVTRLLRFFYYILRNIRSYDAAFIHMNAEYALLGGWIWKLARKRRVLWYTHKSVTMRLRIGSRMVDAICTASAESFRLKRSHTVVTGHGIDTAMFGLPRVKPVDFLRMATVGRITRSKGIHTLLDTMALLPSRGVPYRLSIVGSPVTRRDERYQDELWDKLEELNLSSFAGFIGAKASREIPAVLASTDVFLHASDTGSLDKAMLEAMAAGCVVISSNDAAKPILRMVQDGLAVGQAEPEAFAHAIQKVHALGADRRKEVGERSRAFVAEHHSLVKLVEKIVWILRT